jgi:hypothetical protein
MMTRRKKRSRRGEGCYFDIFEVKFTFPDELSVEFVFDWLPLLARLPERFLDLDCS